MTHSPWAGGEVEVWTIRTAGAGHLLRNEWHADAFALRKRGSCLYFDLANGDVLALEGADWEALARGQTPEDMEMTGVFPSDVFEAMVAPHSRRVIGVTGKGEPLPFHEWVSRYGDGENIHALFRDALREARRGAPERNGCAVFRFHPPVRPWAESDSADGTEKTGSPVMEKTP